MSAAFALAAPPSLLADDSSDLGKAGPLALLVILVLVVVCYFLFRSMSRHLRTVREDFPAGARPITGGVGTPTTGGTAPTTGGTAPTTGEIGDRGA